MRKMPVQGLLQAAAGVFLALGLLGAVVRFYALSEASYRDLFARVGTYERFDTRDADAQASAVILYLKGKPDLPLPGLTQEEARHMADVQGLFRLLRIVVWLLTLSLFVVFALLHRSTQDPWGTFRSVVRIAGGSLVLGAGVLGGVALIAFPIAFHLLHGLFFATDTWIFPQDSVLIRLFPLSFFSLMAQRILLDTLLAGIVLFGVGRFGGRMGEKLRSLL